MAKSKAVIQFYVKTNRKTKLAMDTWVLIGLRLKIIRDMRRLIAEKIWETRFEAPYAMEIVVRGAASPKKVKSN